MEQLSLFEWGDLCHCHETIKEIGAACAVCRMANILDHNFCTNILDLYQTESVYNEDGEYYEDED